MADAVAAGVDAHEARWIGEDVSGREGAAWSGGLDDEVPERQGARFDALVARRLGGEPLQYVLGRWPFRHLDLLVDQRVLIPRPETEWVVEAALEVLAGGGRRPCVVVDLGTGSGAIALAIASERWPLARVVATDVSADAIAVARANLAGVGRRASTVELHHGDWWDAVPSSLRGVVDLVVSNPPYVADAEVLPAEVADWEPAGALRAGPAGLAALRVVVGGARSWLRPDGWLVCEIGATQGPAVRGLAAAAGLVDVEVRPDPAGRDRILLARRPG